MRKWWWGAPAALSALFIGMATLGSMASIPADPERWSTQVFIVIIWFFVGFAVRDFWSAPSPKGKAKAGPSGS